MNINHSLNTCFQVWDHRRCSPLAIQLSLNLGQSCRVRKLTASCIWLAWDAEVREVLSDQSTEGKMLYFASALKDFFRLDQTKASLGCSLIIDIFGLDEVAELEI